MLVLNIYEVKYVQCMCVLFPVVKMTIFNTTQQQSQEHKKVLITGQAKLTLSIM